MRELLRLGGGPRTERVLLGHGRDVRGVRPGEGGQAGARAVHRASREPREGHRTARHGDDRGTFGAVGCDAENPRSMRAPSVTSVALGRENNRGSRMGTSLMTCLSARYFWSQETD